MGITGLLPALKSIQVTKPLTEFSGQTLAVDAYVWLHKGVYACATELATGKNTHKYVDYAMHRVRLLRHYKIEPYIVFDGGPLPAKRGTEDDRKKRREESLARGNALLAQGKNNQARDFYVKCVDVTPQMAYQLIKALRAENVPYVVAPYEADAQMAYLERVGLVDGILTEDSDLLVFGCRNVLFKMDIVTSTVVSISRKDFGSVSTSNSDISLVGWSDVQFREMAILSGCDYLPSVPGVGLKTACNLLRKWKTAEQVVRVLLLEGKKTVPRNYMEQFILADKCFQHQRVYCPISERLVYLNDIGEDWTEEAEAYIGGDLDPLLAKKVGKGDVDPVTLEPMKDIYPGFMPRAKPRSLLSKGSLRDKGKSKAMVTSSKEGILSFFGPNPKIPPRQVREPLSPICVKKTMAGKESGKRTLTGVMERVPHMKPHSQQSKFFSPAPSASSSKQQSKTPENVSGSSQERRNKENVNLINSDDLKPGSDLSMEAQLDVESGMDTDLDDDPVAIVAQEEGYLSPRTSCTEDIQDLSSPLRPVYSRSWECTTGSRDLEFLDEALSSPPSTAKRKHQSNFISRTVLRTRSLDLPSSHILPASKSVSRPNALPPGSFPGPDLQHSFADDRSSDIDCSDGEKRDHPKSRSPTPTPPVPIILNTGVANDVTNPHDMHKQAVKADWQQRWAHGSRVKAHRPSLPILTRRETNVTPRGRHTILHPTSRFRPTHYPRCDLISASKISTGSSSKPWRAEIRRSLPFLGPAKSTDGSSSAVFEVLSSPASGDPCDFTDDDMDDILLDVSRHRLAQFR